MQKSVTGVGILVAVQILKFIEFPEKASRVTVSPAVTAALAQSYVVMTLALGLATAWAISRFPRTDGAMHNK